MSTNKKSRTELKQYFEAEKIPTEQQFSDFIDASLNQVEDCIKKLPGEPIALEAEGEIISTQEIMHLYADFNQSTPSWKVNLNPRVDHEDPSTSRKGLHIEDSTGESRLFINNGNGNVGIGTLEPDSKLTIEGKEETSLLSVVDATQKRTQIFEVSQQRGNGIVTVRNGEQNKETVLESNSIAFIDAKDNANSKSVSITAEEENMNITANRVTISGDVLMNNLSNNETLLENGVSSETIIPSQKAVKEYVDTRLPSGLISMWSGSQIPEGWALCDGNNGTPNLSGRFIVGLDKNNPEYNQTKKTGGLQEVQLTTAQLPAHTHEDQGHGHGVTDPGHKHIGKDSAGRTFDRLIRYTGNNTHKGTDSKNPVGIEYDIDHSGVMQNSQTGVKVKTDKAKLKNTGGNQPHENRPPYFVLAYIMKL